MSFKARYWQKMEDGKLLCELCPRACKIAEGQRGLCFVRGHSQGEMLLYSYGRSSGLCIDPIEKKPLNHFYPGSSVLSFGTAGCNLSCRFCQNWDISKSRKMDRPQEEASPEEIALMAQKNNCRSVAMTYNDPVIFLEYAVDTAQACHERGINTVVVTAGYIMAKAREEFFQHMDAANVDLKAFTEKFYKEQTGSSLEVVKETLSYLKSETQVWFEITTLLIPGLNDSEKEIEELTQWIVEELGQDQVLHFSALHPDFKMTDRPRTPFNTLKRSRDIALKNGLRYVYTGNVHDPEGSSTYCPNCQKLLIERDWYKLGLWQLDDGQRCNSCHTKIPGHFLKQADNWGGKRQRL